MHPAVMITGLAPHLYGMPKLLFWLILFVVAMVVAAAWTIVPPVTGKLPGWLVVLPSISLAWKMPRRPETLNVTPFWVAVPVAVAGGTELVMIWLTMIRVPAYCGAPSVIWN